MNSTDGGDRAASHQQVGLAEAVCGLSDGEPLMIGRDDAGRLACALLMAPLRS